MILLDHSVKMLTLSRDENPAIQVDEIEDSPSYFKRIVAAVAAKRSKRQVVGDVVVITFVLPMLLLCSVLLHTSMRSDWVRDTHMRWRILTLGLSLLFLSLFICFYATHRLGLNIWKSQQQRQQEIVAIGRTRRRTISSRGILPAPLIATDSEMQLMVGRDMPPSYDSVMAYTDLPPPYCAAIVCDEKSSEITRSLNIHRGLPAAPSGTG